MSLPSPEERFAPVALATTPIRWLRAVWSRLSRLLKVVPLTGLIGCGGDGQIPSTPGHDQSVSGISEHPLAVVAAKVGTYPALVKSGAGYFYDDVLEYRVWMHPERGAPSLDEEGGDYFVAFAQYEKALAFSKASPGAEEPLVLVRQMEYINEPEEGVYEAAKDERLTEWRVEWLEGSKRQPDSIEKFLREHGK
ncbi:GCN5 family acetyltransferase [Verrucomicrobium sp. BvORR106]|uniref:GCN5 family acetyltransferase n=1 Tax=Verrucomicrobium sp. BvORR106 TaxID=1403819 RepID=UPI002240F7B0|nr:GCN5 family acetyltransferase [Verrucomicrobium sp. BvORR106]